MNEVGGFSEARLVASAIEANVEHLKDALVQEDEGVVYGFRIEGVGIRRSGENEFAVFVRGAKGSDFG